MPIVNKQVKFSQQNINQSDMNTISINGNMYRGAEQYANRHNISVPADENGLNVLVEQKYKL